MVCDPAVLDEKLYDAAPFERASDGFVVVPSTAMLTVPVGVAVDAVESEATLIVIASLAGDERKSASDLCKGISYDAGAMTRMLDRLEGKGLIRRSRSPEDRRLVHLELTDEGRAAYPRMRELSLAVANRFLRGFSKAEARTLEGLLNRMLDNAQPAEGRESA